MAADGAKQPEPAAAAPLRLDPILAAGATLCGHPVRAVVIETTDGRRQRFELPPPVGADDAVPLTSTQRAVVDLFAKHDPDARLKGPVVARLLGVGLDGLKKPLSELVKLDVLSAEQGVAGYARGGKFPET